MVSATFSSHLAAYVLGLVNTSQLPEVAEQALAEGVDSNSLAALAGTTDSELLPSQLEALFLRGLSEAHLTLPSTRQAALILRDHYAALVANGALAPTEGARFICRDLYTLAESQFPSAEFVGDTFGIARLVGIFYSHDDVPPDDTSTHRGIDADIIKECRRLVGG